MELRRLVGRAVETKYKGLDVRCVFSDDTGQHGALGFVCDTYVGGEKSHRTVYSYHASPTHVSTTTVGPGNHRASDFLPIHLFSAKIVVVREASWARAFFRPAARATASAEVHSKITHQQDAQAVLMQYILTHPKRTFKIGAYEVEVSRTQSLPYSTVAVLVSLERRSTSSMTFESYVWATTPKAYVHHSHGRSFYVDVDCDRSVKGIIEFVLKTVLKSAEASAQTTKAQVDLAVTRRLK